MSTLGRGSNPCSVLNSYHQGCKYELVEERGPPHMKEFMFRVCLGGDEFLGKGRSKKLAKQAAASNALRAVYGINLSLSGTSDSLGKLNHYNTDANYVRYTCHDDTSTSTIDVL